MFHYRPAPACRVERRKARREEDFDATVTAGQSSLLDALKKLRLNLARERNVPAYLIFSDRTLLDMARRRPRDIGEFAEVNGVGASKLKDFAKVFLSAIRAHRDGAPDAAVTAESSA